MKTEMKEIDVVIEDVRLYTDTSYFIENFEECHEISDLWTEKRPKFYGDTDIIVVTLKTAKGKKITDMFPVVLRFDGTLEPNAESRRSRLRRHRLASFLKHYGITEKTEGYNILERMKEWKGKKLKVVRHGERDQIFIPGHLIRDLEYPERG